MSSKLTKRKSGIEADNKAPAAGSAIAEEKARYTKMIEEASGKAPPKLAPYIKQAAPFMAMALVYFEVALPHIIKAITIVQEQLAKLPEDILYCIMGVCICFFGGVFPATIAAFEAWRLCGGVEAIEHCKKLLAECQKVVEASKEDDLVDADGDGVADVNQTSGKALLARKVSVALKTVDPEHISQAITGIYTGWIGVLAVLKIQFAKAVTLGEVIGQRMYDIAKKGEPAIEAVFPADYHKWIPSIVRWTCKAIAISIVWWVQRICSAVHSAIRGGHLVAEHSRILLDAKGIKIPLPDEAFAWAIAAAGLIFQWICGFGVPFPLNLVLWPLHIVEWFIIWSLTNSSGSSF